MPSQDIHKARSSESRVRATTSVFAGLLVELNNPVLSKKLLQFFSLPEVVQHLRIIRLLCSNHHSWRGLRILSRRVPLIALSLKTSTTSHYLQRSPRQLQPQTLSDAGIGMAGGRHSVCVLRPNCSDSDAPFVALSLAGNQRHLRLTTTDCHQSSSPRELE